MFFIDCNSTNVHLKSLRVICKASKKHQKTENECQLFNKVEMQVLNVNDESTVYNMEILIDLDISLYKTKIHF